MRILARLLDHKEISDQGDLIQVYSRKVRSKKASEEKSSTDSTNVNDQVSQHIDWVLDYISLSAEENIDFKRSSFNKLIWRFGVVSLIANFRNEKAFFVLRLSHFPVSAVVVVVNEHSLLYSDVTAHHLITNDWINKTIHDFVRNFNLIRLGVEGRLQHREVESMFSQVIFYFIVAILLLAHLKKDSKAVYLLVRAVSFYFVVLVTF